ncbi:MAG: SGNH/GDSL hydrolase family protein [Clostridia bacterium]|nr:SGNH/GDSL hydrolase family protein [Clostridia bacterium]
MENFINLDKNMIVNKTIGDVPVTWHDVRNDPFEIHGLYQPKTESFFHRLPMDVAAATSPAVERLSQESAGGRVRFTTDSPFIAIRATYRVVGRSSHLTLVSSAGFDLYMDDDFGSRFVKEFRMPYDMESEYEQIYQMKNRPGMHSYTINFPVHSVVESLWVGLAPEARLASPKPYRDLAPIVFYGSSIVHGTAASRPGYIYENFICRMLNMDYVNLGFSGNAKGEQVLSDYMATLPMSIFVCDYDHNAPSPEFLEETHYPIYETIRKTNPDVPYIMITRPNFYTNQNTEDTLLRRDVVMRSYLKARETGDKNVYFIDGTGFFADAQVYECTMDHIHPNDTGFMRMGETIATLIRYILEH